MKQLKSNKNFDYEKIKKFIQMHFSPNEDIFSFINIGSKYTDRKIVIDKNGKITNRARGVYTCHCLKNSNIEQLDKTKSFRNFFVSMSPYKDYYITANGFKNSRVRNTDSVFTLHNIVIDIDCHNPSISIKEMDMAISSFLYFFEDLYNVPDFPTPNTIVNTGRGIQIWWAINPLSYKLKDVYNAVRNDIIKKIEEMFKSVETLKILKLDKTASKNYCGYYRFPGSYNSKVGRQSSFSFYSEEYLDLLEYYKKIENPIYEKIVNKKGLFNLDIYRENVLYRLISLRNHECNGYRDLMALILCNAYLSCNRTEDEAKEAVLRLNQEFSVPMPENKLLSYMSSSFRKYYKFTNKKIIEILDITDEEQKKLNFYSNETVKKAKEEKRKIKRSRNQQIIILFLQGLTQIEIASLVGCSQPTVCRVIKKYNSTLKSKVGLFSFGLNSELESNEDSKNEMLKQKNLLKRIKDFASQFSINVVPVFDG